MPTDDLQAIVASEPAATPDGGTPSGNPNSAKPVVWETWLSDQPAEVKAAYDLSVKNLKAALEAERQARKAAEKGKTATAGDPAEATTTLTTQVQALTAERDGLAVKLAQVLQDTAIQQAAAALNFIKPELALKLIDRDSLKQDDHGVWTGITEALRTLVTDSPFLVKTPDLQGTDLDAVTGRPVEAPRSATGYTIEQLAAMKKTQRSEYGGL